MKSKQKHLYRTTDQKRNAVIHIKDSEEKIVFIGLLYRVDLVYLSS